MEGRGKEDERVKGRDRNKERVGGDGIVEGRGKEDERVKGRDRNKE